MTAGTNKRKTRSEVDVRVLRFWLVLALSLLTVSCRLQATNSKVGQVFTEQELPANLRQALETPEKFVPAAASPGAEMTWDVPAYRALLPSTPKGDKQAFRRAVNTPKSLDQLYARLRVEVWRDLRRTSKSPAPGTLQVHLKALHNPTDGPLLLRGPILIVETENPLRKTGADYSIGINRIWVPEIRALNNEIAAFGGPPLPAETWLDVIVHAEIGGEKIPLRLRQMKVKVYK